MSIYTTPLMFNAVVGLVLAAFVFRGGFAPGARALGLMILAAALWSTGYALEFLVPGPEAKLFWAKFQYFGIVTIPPVWFAFSRQLLGARAWPARWRGYGPLLAGIPLLTLVLVWTNERHGLIWSQVRLETAGSLTVLQLEHGPAFWLFLLYGYALLAWGSAQVLRQLFSAVRLHRWQIMAALVAVVVPWLGNLAYATHVSPLPHLDLTPFAFTASGLLFVVTLFRFRLIDIVPIAQETVFAGLADCILVLDARDCIADLNPAALRMLGKRGRQPFGKALAQAAPELARQVAPVASGEDARFDLAYGEAPHQHVFEVRVTPLGGAFQDPIGRLIVCHEITEVRQQQARLESARAHLELEVSERTGELREAIGRLQHELTQRTLAEKRFEEVVEGSPDAMVLADQDGTILLLNAEAERLFGYSRDELLGQNVASLIPASRLQAHREVSREYLRQPAVRQIGFGPDMFARRKDGSLFPVELSLGPLNTDSGVWVACNIRDVSERVKAEQARSRLLDELTQSHDQLRALTARLEEVREVERREIATELHDRVGQNLTALNLNLQVVRTQLDSQASAQVQHRLIDSLKLVEETTRQVRMVMTELHPPVLDEYGLVSALQWYAGVFAQRTGIATEVRGEDFAPRLPPNTEIVLFRLVQEALNNVAKHARASRVAIAAQSSPESVCLAVEDDGLGFDPQAPMGAAGEAHWGLITMQQRAASIRGQVLVDSAPGRGTRIAVSVPRGDHEGH